MQIINKNTNSTIVFTLFEKQTLETPYFLFKLVNRIDGVARYFIAQDLSEYKERYNKFLVTERTSNLNATSGIIYLPQEGEYSYEVFEQNSSTNLDPSLSDNVVPIENGIIKVVGTDPVTIQHNNSTDEYIIYGSGA